MHVTQVSQQVNNQQIMEKEFSSLQTFHWLNYVEVKVPSTDIQLHVKAIRNEDYIKRKQLK